MARATDHEAVADIARSVPQGSGPGGDLPGVDGDQAEDWDDDAVLEQIHRTGQELRTAHHRLRLLLAYAREFQGRRPYPLSWLAEAAGMSASGVRTAYDRDDVRQVAEIVGERATARRR